MILTPNVANIVNVPLVNFFCVCDSLSSYAIDDIDDKKDNE